MFLRKMIFKQLSQRGSQLTRPFASRTGRNFFATSCAILGVFANSRGLANSHGGLITTPRAGFVTFHAGLDVSAILKTLPMDKIYNLSVVLYASSLLNDSELYKKALAEITAQLEKEPNSSFKAWMVARVLLAAENVDDETVVEKTRRH